MDRQEMTHIYDRSDLVRSVLFDAEVSALCGFKKKHSRDSLARELADGCGECLRLFDAIDPESVAMRPRGSWLDLIEAEMRKRLSPPVATTAWYTVSVSGWKKWPKESDR